MCVYLFMYMKWVCVYIYIYREISLAWLVIAKSWIESQCLYSMWLVNKVFLSRHWATIENGSYEYLCTESEKLYTMICIYWLQLCGQKITCTKNN